MQQGKDMRILKIKLNELSAFCESRLFRFFSVKPISPLRVDSYLNNPRANGNDTVLYLLLAGDELIAFRSILPDYVLFQGEIVKFGWCSGAWVTPRHRGQRLSIQLFDAVCEDWKDGLMFTNYTYLSERNYLSTHKFNLLEERIGLRFYLFPHLNQIYKNRSGYSRIKFILPFLSFGISTVSFIRSFIYNIFYSKTNYVEMAGLDRECRNYLKKYPDTFFNRREKELDWIIQYPWITQSNQEDFVYPFSYLKNNYSLKVVKIMEENNFSGFFIYTIIQSKMKILYYFMETNLLPRMIDVVSQLAMKEKIEYLTLLNPPLARLFKKKNKCFAFSKGYISHVYSSLSVSNESSRTIFDGDGDYCFT
jgi:hypothetical protein